MKHKAKTDTGKKAWAGRFEGAADPRMEAFTSSLMFDRRLAHYDIQGSQAHCRMLVKQKLLTRTEGDKIRKGLERVQREIEQGRFPFLASDEDIHMAVERRLTEKIGLLGGKLHTARSRNDQVLLDVRLYLREETKTIHKLLTALQKRLARLAKRHCDVVMPGYTHLQRAQPVLLAHHLLAYYEMLDRDAERLQECQQRINVLPLGAGALAGTSLPIDRAYVARLLGFARVSTNSLDTVADRDFLVEFLSVSAIISMHLSRFAEELVLWASSEFQFIELPDAFATGSSMMPQKKNPDVPEIIRGKTGRVYGNLFALLTTLKAYRWPIIGTSRRTRSRCLIRSIPSKAYSACWKPCSASSSFAPTGCRPQPWAALPWLPMSPTIWLKRACRSEKPMKSWLGSCVSACPTTPAWSSCLLKSGNASRRCLNPTCCPA